MSAKAQGEAAGQPVACAIVQRYGVTCPWLRASQHLEIPYNMVLALADAAVHGRKGERSIWRQLAREPQLYRVSRYPGGMFKLQQDIEAYAIAWRAGEITP